MKLMPMSCEMWLVLVMGACLVAVEFLLYDPWMSTQSLPPRILNDSTQLRTCLDKEAAGTVVEPSSAVVNSFSLAIEQSKKPSLLTLPTLYIITPTYRRPEQIAELTRLSQTLMHVPNLHWLVIEDSEVVSPQVARLLTRTGLTFSHLVAPMPKRYKRNKVKPKGVSNRNRGLEWLRANATAGVVYFADDDNTYDLDVFKEMRLTKKVSMWPVGLCTEFGVSSPVVRDGVIVGFYGWINGRKFAVDMAGFAVNVEFLLQRPNAKIPYRPCFEEDGFLKSLAPFEIKDIELNADNCTRILVWHTKAYMHRPAPRVNLNKYSNTNLALLKDLIV